MFQLDSSCSLSLHLYWQPTMFYWIAYTWYKSWYHRCVQFMFPWLGLYIFKAGFRLTCRSLHCRYIAWSPLAFSELQGYTALALNPERHLCQVERKSTVSGLQLWEKRRSYRLIGSTLFTTWAFLCGEWCLRSCTKIIIKAAMRWAAI